MDTSIVLALHAWTTAQPVLATSVALLAEAGIVVLPILLVVVWLRAASIGPGTREAVLSGCIGAVIAFAIGYGLEHLLSRPRPFLELGFTPLFPHAADSSFPSDHTLVGAALVGPLLWRVQRLGVLAFFWALLVGAARVAAGVHYPTDIIGSAILALAIDAVLWLTIRPVLVRLSPLRLDAGARGKPRRAPRR
ncbi:MAG TPA: phosphatase PAP2 family protein [Chloroflexota bacterium]|nr:phosphatase PAP2 family protein [Chloroflexota bacterium]